MKTWIGVQIQEARMASPAQSQPRAGQIVQYASMDYVVVMDLMHHSASGLDRQL